MSKTKDNHYLTALPQFNKKALYVAIVSINTALATAVYAGPEGGEVVGGEGSITQTDDTTTTINQNTDLMAINWDSFDVAADERVVYVQPDSDSISLNTILSHNGSQINGQIDANGHVFLVNPNGVVFGDSAQVNVGGMLASGLAIASA
jgi:filamentous hemagglutinin family protein